jgi:hypothetical protein
MLIIGAVGAGCAAILFCWYYFSINKTEAVTQSARTTSSWPQTHSVTNSQPQVTRQAPLTTTSTPYGVTYVQPATTSPDAPAYVSRNTAAIQEAQLAEQRRQAEERQRAQIERERLAAERARQEEKARGQDMVIPLDEYHTINVGGVAVSVKIHDNDVTSFDVWTNGQWRREVPKQKGITHTRTDETLIYDAGRSRLYYVWEPSGKLNHCLLRVREQ